MVSTDLKGVTLLELLVVISIIAVISGIGLAFFSHSNRQLDFQGTAGEIISILRYARSTARTEKMLTRVMIDPAKREIYYFKRQTLGLWHFEDDALEISTGAFNRPAKLLEGARLTDDGKFGRAVLMDGIGLIDCGDIPVVSPEQGLEIEAWVYLFGATFQTIVEKHGEYSFQIESDGSLTARVGHLSLTTASALVPLNCWAHLMFVYDTETLRIFINKQSVAVVDGKTELKNDRSYLTISSPGSRFNGKIDEVKINAIVKSEIFKLQPSDLVITAPLIEPNGLITLEFDDRGRLKYQSIPGTPADNEGVQIKFTAPSSNSSFILEIDGSGNAKIKW